MRHVLFMLWVILILGALVFSCNQQANATLWQWGGSDTPTAKAEIAYWIGSDVGSTTQAVKDVGSATEVTVETVFPDIIKWDKATLGVRAYVDRTYRVFVPVVGWTVVPIRLYSEWTLIEYTPKAWQAAPGYWRTMRLEATR